METPLYKLPREKYLSILKARLVQAGALGRTTGGQFTHRGVLSVVNPRTDYHPDSKNWENIAQGPINQLKGHLGEKAWNEWAESVLPDVDKFTYLELYDMAKAALDCILIGGTLPEIIDASEKSLSLNICEECQEKFKDSEFNKSTGLCGWCQAKDNTPSDIPLKKFGGK